MKENKRKTRLLFLLTEDKRRMLDWRRGAKSDCTSAPPAESNNAGEASLLYQRWPHSHPHKCSQRRVILSLSQATKIQKVDQDSFWIQNQCTATPIKAISTFFFLVVLMRCIILLRRATPWFPFICLRKIIWWLLVKSQNTFWITQIWHSNYRRIIYNKGKQIKGVASIQRDRAGNPFFFASSHTNKTVWQR